MRWQHGGSMVAAWWQHGGSMVAAWWQHGGSMVAAWWHHGDSMVAAWWQQSVAAGCHHARRYLGSRHVARRCATVNRGRRLGGGGCDGTDEGEGHAEGKEGHQHAHQHLVARRKRVQGHGGAGISQCILKMSEL